MTTAWWRVLVVAAALIGAADRDAAGCSCGASGPPCQAAWTADAVFAGIVLSTEELEANGADRPYPSILVKFQVERGFLNAAPGPVEITTGTGGGDCGYTFKAGERYVVYARKTSSSRLSTGICSRTRLLTEAQADLRYFTSMPSPGDGGRIFGRINESRRDPAEERAVDYGPVEGVTVSVRGARFLQEVATGPDGRFVVPHLPVGQVTVTVVPSFGFSTRHLERELEIKDPRACGQADFTISQIASAFGVIVDASGRPLAGVEVDAVAGELAGFGPAAFQRPERTDARGAFEFADLPPGSYVFGINLTTAANRRPAGTPVFLPGTPLWGKYEEQNPRQARITSSVNQSSRILKLTRGMDF